MASYVTADLKNPDGLLVQEIAERMSGNICRCSAYPNIIKAISQVLESQVAEKSVTDVSTTNAKNGSQVTGIWSPPPSQTQLGNASNRQQAANTQGGRS